MKPVVFCWHAPAFRVAARSAKQAEAAAGKRAAPLGFSAAVARLIHPSMPACGRRPWQAHPLAMAATR